MTLDMHGWVVLVAYPTVRWCVVLIVSGLLTLAFCEETRVWRE